MMSLILFWALTVLFTWQSMGRHKPHGFHQKYLKLGSDSEEAKTNEAFTGLKRHGGK